MGAGAALVVLLIVLPAAVRDDFYEITDPLVYLGAPIVVVSAAIGALVGAPGSRGADENAAGKAQPSSLTARAALATVTVAAMVLAVWFFLSAIGAVDAGPLGLG